MTANGRRLGFVGFGAMAGRMAARLRTAGYTVIAFDPGQKNAEVDGVQMVGSAASLAGQVDAVLVSVPADAALEQSVEGPGGVLEGARAGLLLIDLSSVSPGASRKLAEQAAAKGVLFVEAPVSGSTPEAEHGELVVLVGGTEAGLKAAAPILDVIGRKTIHAGPVGSGMIMKLAVNGVMGMGTAALAEALAYGVRSGLDRNTLIDLFSDLALVSDHHKRKLAMAKAGSYPPQFPARLMAKDMGLLLADAGKLGVPMASMAATTQLFALTTVAHADEDYAAAILTMEQLAEAPAKNS